MLSGAIQYFAEAIRYDLEPFNAGAIRYGLARLAAGHRAQRRVLSPPPQRDAEMPPDRYQAIATACASGQQPAHIDIF